MIVFLLRVWFCRNQKGHFWHPFCPFGISFLQEKKEKESKHAKRLLELDVLQRKVGRFFSHWGVLFPLVFFLRSQASGIGEELRIRLSQEHLLVFGDPKKADQCG